MFPFIQRLYLLILSTPRNIYNLCNTVLALVYRTLLTSDNGTQDGHNKSGPPAATPNVETIEIRRYYPPGVSQIIGRGGETFIGTVDESTVLKYPCIPDNRESIKIEARILEILGNHPRVVASKGMTEHGLLL